MALVDAFDLYDFCADAKNGRNFYPKPRINHQSYPPFKANLIQRYEKLLLDGKFSDCCFHIGSEKLKAHKIFLASASPVFEAMFYGPLCEIDSNVDIYDMSMESFQLLLHYIYTGQIEFDKLTIENTIELYYGAEKYMIKELRDECLTTFHKKLRFQNILPALELSFCMNLENIVEICIDFVTKCCLTVINFGDFFEKNYCHLPKKCLQKIIAANKRFQAHRLVPFVSEWCLQESTNLSLDSGRDKDEAFLSLWNELQVMESDEANRNLGKELLKRKMLGNQIKGFSIIKRNIYKASRPFTIGMNLHEYKINFKCDYSLFLNGILLPSRLLPRNCRKNPILSSSYSETFSIQIVAVNSNVQCQLRDDADPKNNKNELQTNMKWTHEVVGRNAQFNTDLLIQWYDEVVLIPNWLYQMTIRWPETAYGAEYPCSFMSTRIDGIHFDDLDGTGLGLIKGLSIKKINCLKAS